MKRAPFFLGAVAAVLVACGGAGEDASSSESNHTEGAYIFDNSPFNWAPSTYEELVKVRPGTSARGIVLPDSHRLTKRLQAWADQIDGIVRAKVEKEHGSFAAPKPTVKVMQAVNTFNAWVTGAPACFGMPLTGGKAAGQEPRAVVMLATDGMSAEPDFCLHPASWKDRDGFLTAWNASASPCKVKVASGKAEVACSKFNGNDFGSYGASPYIHYSTDLLSVLDEKTALLILAHELGHYYHGHQSPLVGQKYGFWYDQDPNAPRTPVPAAEAKELEKVYRAVVNAPKPVGTFASKYNARTRKFLLRGVGDLLKTAGVKAVPECAAASRLLAGGGLEGRMIDVGAIDAPLAEQFTAYETKLAECAAKVTLAPSEDALTPGAPSMLFDDATNAADTDLWELTIPAHATTFADLLEKLSKAADDVDVTVKQLADRLADNHVGLYTIEQEADEIALEIMTKLGVSPAETLQAWIRFIGATDAKRGTNEAAECQAMLDSGFQTRGAGGKPSPMLVSMGDLEDPHHGVCYRLYNLWRETRAHAYEAQGTYTSVGPAWDDLRAEAKKLSTDPVK